MLRGKRRALGIALDERALRVAEIRVSGAGRVLARSAELAMGDGVSLADPPALGAALKALLRENGIAARKAAIGVPLRWLLVLERTFPATDDETFLRMARLESERAFAGSGQDMAVTCSDHTDAQGRRCGLIVAMARDRLDALVEVAKAAKVTVLAVTPTVLALASAAKASAGESWTVYAQQDYAELVRRREGSFSAIRSVPLAAGSDRGAGLAEGMRQVMALQPYEQSASGAAELHVWDGAGQGAGEFGSLGERLGLAAADVPGLASLNVTADAEAEGCYAAAAAVAIVGQANGRGLIDLLHSRLVRRAKRAVGRMGLWAAALVATAGAVGLSVADTWRQDRRDAGELKVQLARLAPDVDAARSTIKQVVLARGWFDRRPHFLDCLRQITLAFPEEGSTWATSIGMREDMRAVISGKSADEGSVLAVRDRLAGSSAFSDVRLLYLRETGGARNDLSFAIQLQFVGRE